MSEQVAETAVPELSLAAVQVFLDSWRDVALDTLRLDIDKHAIAMYDADGKSQASRAELAQAVKELKNVSQEEQVKALRKTLKLFQKEVDQLTERAKSAENAYQHLYKTFYQAPDPFPALGAYKHLMEKHNKTEAEHKEYKKRVEQYEEEFKKIQNQEVSIRNLKKENAALLEKVKNNSDEAIAEQKQKYESAIEEIGVRFQEREKELMNQIQAKEDALMQSHQDYDKLQTQLFNLRAAQGKQLSK
jgi:homeobox protein cut-like